MSVFDFSELFAQPSTPGTPDELSMAGQAIAHNPEPADYFAEMDQAFGYGQPSDRLSDAELVALFDSYELRNERVQEQLAAAMDWATSVIANGGERGAA